jgi:hypothetical protein
VDKNRSIFCRPCVAIEFMSLFLSEYIRLQQLPSSCRRRFEGEVRRNEKVRIEPPPKERVRNAKLGGTRPSRCGHCAARPKYPLPIPLIDFSQRVLIINLSQARQSVQEYAAPWFRKAAGRFLRAERDDRSAGPDSARRTSVSGGLSGGVPCHRSLKR